jgi:hypothetical protein
MIAAGFALEYVKVSLNFVIEFAAMVPDYDEINPSERKMELAAFRRNSPSDYYHSHEPLSALYLFQQKDLFMLKWLVVAIALIGFGLLNAISLKILSNDNAAMRWLALIYGLIIVLSAIFFVVERVAFSETHTFAVARKILNAGQSGIPGLIVLIINKMKIQQGYAGGLE